MTIPNSLEELASYIETRKSVFFFTVDWCGDCRFIKPQMPKVENDFSDWQFIEVDRDKYIDVATERNIFDIPNSVVTQDREELGCLVNKGRKAKQEIESFLEGVVKG